MWYVAHILHILIRVYSAKTLHGSPEAQVNVHKVAEQYNCNIVT